MTYLAIWTGSVLNAKLPILKLRLGLVALVLALLFALALPAFAQDPTIVPLVIPINPIFTQTNNWMNVFAPIVAIGIGISVALAILAFIGKQITAAF